jgi:hypothetical protein
MQFGKFLVLLQQDTADPNRTVATAVIALALKSRLIEKQKRFEDVPVLHNCPATDRQEQLQHGNIDQRWAAAVCPEQHQGSSRHLGTQMIPALRFCGEKSQRPPLFTAMDQDSKRVFGDRSRLEKTSVDPARCRAHGRRTALRRNAHDVAVPQRNELDDVDDVVAGARQSAGQTGARSRSSVSAPAFFFSHRLAM